MTVEEDAIEFCKNKGSQAWILLSVFLRDRNFLGGRERSQYYNMGRQLSQNREPSELLSKACMKIWVDSEKHYEWKYDDGQE